MRIALFASMLTRNRIFGVCRTPEHVPLRSAEICLTTMLSYRLQAKFRGLGPGALQKQWQNAHVEAPRTGAPSTTGVSSVAAGVAQMLTSSRPPSSELE